MTIFKALTLVLATAAVPGVSIAQDVTIGETEYMNSCAQCHGPAGKGDGVMIGFLTVRAPDLSALQRSNGGVFPVARVYSVIDGSAVVGSHGSSDMPAWGRRYGAKASSVLGWEYGRSDQEAFVRGRILALVEYIATLQEE